MEDNDDDEENSTEVYSITQPVFSIIHIYPFLAAYEDYAAIPQLLFKENMKNEDWMTQGLLDEIHFFYHNAVTFPRVVKKPDIPRHSYLRHNAFLLLDASLPVTNSWIK